MAPIPAPQGNAARCDASWNPQVSQCCETNDGGHICRSEDGFLEYTPDNQLAKILQEHPNMCLGGAVILGIAATAITAYRIAVPRIAEARRRDLDTLSRGLRRIAAKSYFDEGDWENARRVYIDLSNGTSFDQKAALQMAEQANAALRAQEMLNRNKAFMSLNSSLQRALILHIATQQFPNDSRDAQVASLPSATDDLSDHALFRDSINTERGTTNLRAYTLAGLNHALRSSAAVALAGGEAIQVPLASVELSGVKPKELFGIDNPNATFRVAAEEVARRTAADASMKVTVAPIDLDKHAGASADITRPTEATTVAGTTGAVGTRGAEGIEGAPKDAREGAPADTKGRTTAEEITGNGKVR